MSGPPTAVGGLDIDRFRVFDGGSCRLVWLAMYFAEDNPIGYLTRSCACTLTTLHQQTLPLISVFALAFLIMVLCQRAAGIRQYISQDLRLPISSPTTPSQSPAPSSPRPSVELDIEAEDASDVEILQEPPLDDANSSARFPINWKLIKNSQGKLLYKYGRLGHRIRHRRQQGVKI